VTSTDEFGENRDTAAAAEIEHGRAWRHTGQKSLLPSSLALGRRSRAPGLTPRVSHLIVRTPNGRFAVIHAECLVVATVARPSRGG
jgi:hypothetical protein